MDKDIKDIGILGTLFGLSVFGAIYFNQSTFLFIGMGATYLGIKDKVSPVETLTSDEKLE